jgi:hypothetical protein
VAKIDPSGPTATPIGPLRVANAVGLTCAVAGGEAAAAQQRATAANRTAAGTERRCTGYLMRTGFEPATPRP